MADFGSLAPELPAESVAQQDSVAAWLARRAPNMAGFGSLAPDVPVQNSQQSPSAIAAWLARMALPNAAGLVLGDAAPPIANFPEVPGKIPEVGDPRFANAIGEAANIGVNLVGPPMKAAGSMAAAGMLGLGKLVGAAREARPFYSAVEDTIASASQNAAQPAQWSGMIKNAPGVKPEEMQWLGLDDWLKAQGNRKVSKQEIADYVRGNQVELKEIGKGGEEVSLDPDHWHQDPPMDAPGGTETWMYHRNLPPQDLGFDTGIMAHHDESGQLAGFQTFLEGKPIGEHDNFGDAAHQIANAVGKSAGGTKFGSYQLPGGENYRELLLTMPEGGPVVTRLKEIQRRLGDINNLPAAEHRGPNGPALLQEFDALQSEKARLRNEIPDTYKSPHWDEPNVLAHVRFNDRVIDGKKTLFLEEIQSDWHQKGRTGGYRISDDEAQRLHSREQELIQKGREATESEKQEWADIRNRLQQQAVPDAPFKTTWPELALKRMIRHASENGYDQIAWTPGEVQAERYDLSKHLDSVAVKKAPSDDGYVIVGMKDGRNVYGSGGIPKNKIAEYIGKELGERAVADLNKLEQQPGGKEYHGVDYSGLDLKVGGAGMKGFYDKMLPAAANKLGKKYGAKVEQGALGGSPTRVAQNSLGYWDVYVGDTKVVESLKTREGAERQAAKESSKGQPVHTLPITPDLRKTAVGKGFPLFALGVTAAGALGGGAGTGNPQPSKAAPVSFGSLAP